MQIFLDTANIEQIRQGAKLGVIAGVTTNPSLMMKEGLADYEAAVKEICKIIPGPVSVEVNAEDAAGMIKQGRPWQNGRLTLSSRFRLLWQASKLPPPCPKKKYRLISPCAFP